MFLKNSVILNLINVWSFTKNIIINYYYYIIFHIFQFRVESMMLRLAKNKNYVAVSPSIKQRAEMNAPQSLPLIMEPESKY